MKLKKQFSIFGFAFGLLSAFYYQSAAAQPHPPSQPNTSSIEISDGPLYDFGLRAIGSSSVHTFTVTNTSSSSVTLHGGRPLPQPFYYLGGSFPGNGGTCAESLNPAQSCTVVVQFLPGYPGEFVAALEIKYSTGSIMSPQTQPLSVARRIMKGSSVPYGPLSISESPEYNYGDIPFGITATHTFTLTNTGYAPIYDIKPAFNSTNGEMFNFAGGTYPGTGGTCGNVLNPGGSCTIVVSFSPAAENTYSAILALFYKSGAGGPYVATQGLTGRGILAPVELGQTGDSTCARFSDGRIKCWGDNATGNLGLGDTTDRGTSPDQMGANLPFVDLGTGRTVKRLSRGGGSICAILDNNSLKCWGANTFGQLGLGDTDPRGLAPGQMGNNLPSIDLGTGLYPKKVAIGNASVCALLNNNKIKCWGRNDRGQLGLGDTEDRGDQPGEMGDNLPFVNLGNDVDNEPYEAVDIVATFISYCALLKSGNVKCWGGNNQGQLGLNDTNGRGALPNQMGDNLPFLDFGDSLTVKQLAGGRDHVCALLSNDRVRCWGFNFFGQLGIGNAINQADSPARPLSAIPFVNFGADSSPIAIYSGPSADHTCALFASGRIKCWGLNGSGQLGLGNTLDRGVTPDQMGSNLPFVDVGTNLTVREVVNHSSSTCAILSNFQVKCWGRNDSGQLGLGDTMNRGDQPGEMGVNLPFVRLL